VAGGAMRFRQVAADTYVLVFDKGDEAMAELRTFAEEHELGAAHFTGIGAFSSVVFGYFDRRRMDYDRTPLDEQVELLSIVGDVALDEGKPKVHAHVVVGRSDGSASGGHLLEGNVWPTLELVLTTSPAHLQKRSDSETGLALIDLNAEDQEASETKPPTMAP
jgi:predicted DNA-binding protein with PD1-like motif